MINYIQEIGRLLNITIDSSKFQSINALQANADIAWEYKYSKLSLDDVRIMSAKEKSLYNNARNMHNKLSIQPLRDDCVESVMKSIFESLSVKLAQFAEKTAEAAQIAEKTAEAAQETTKTK